jgi:hypothetical protein
MTASRSIAKPAKASGLRRWLMAAVAAVTLGVVALPSVANAQAYYPYAGYYSPYPYYAYNYPYPYYGYYGPSFGFRFGGWGGHGGWHHR